MLLQAEGKTVLRSIQTQNSLMDTLTQWSNSTKNRGRSGKHQNKLKNVKLNTFTHREKKKQQNNVSE